MLVVSTMVGMPNVVLTSRCHLQNGDLTKAIKTMILHTSTGASASCTLEASFSMETLLIMEMESKEEWMECGALLRTKSDSMDPQ